MVPQSCAVPVGLLLCMVALAMLAAVVVHLRSQAQITGRLRADAQMRDVLLRTLTERSPGLQRDHADIAHIAGLTAARMGLHPDQIDHVIRAAELVDIGKVAIPDDILHKPGPLDHSEWLTMRTHPLIAERILTAAPSLLAVGRIVRSSAERVDGDGYPDGLHGDDIPLGSRIVAACDAYAAMVAARPYRPGLAHSEAVGELLRCAGTQFDPDVINALVAVLDDLDADRDNWDDPEPAVAHHAAP